MESNASASAESESLQRLATLALSSDGTLDAPFQDGHITLDDFLDFSLHKMYANWGRAANPDSSQYFRLLDRIEGVGPCECYIFAAAAKYCARDSTSELPPKADLKQFLVACKDSRLSRLESIDAEQQSTSQRQQQQARSSIFQAPLLLQLIVALALTLRNDNLAKAIIAKYPPTTNADRLLGGHLTSWKEYGPPPKNLVAISHPVFRPIGGVAQSLVDNGCDICLAFLRAGWVKPHPEMLKWACTSPIKADGRAVLQELAETLRRWTRKDTENMCRYLRSVLLDGRHVELVGDVLAIVNPKKHGLHKESQQLSQLAAAAKGPRHLELLLEHDADDFYGLEEGYQRRRKYQDFFVEGEHQYFRSTAEKTALHAAAQDGNVESVLFLLRRGAAPRLKDGWGRTAYEAALYQRSLPPPWRAEGQRLERLEKVITIFEEYGWHLPEAEENVRTG